MKKHLLALTSALFFVACGGGGGNSGTTPIASEETTNTEVTNTTTTSTGNTDTSSLKIALTNTGTVVEEVFNEYVLKITTSNDLEEAKETSQSTIAIYGTVNGTNTNSLLKMNTNYVGSSISVLVFKDDVLVGQSETFNVDSEDAINFGEITIN